MENLVKVGKTSRDTESRAKELSSVTGVPTPFIVAFDAFFGDCSQAEDYVHNKLEQRGYRLASNREFFQAPLKEVIKTIIEAQQVLQLVYDNTQIQTGEHNSNLLEESGEPWIEIESLAYYYVNTGNMEEGYRLYRKALSLGSNNAYFMLGRMTLRGDGCLEDKKEAIEYFGKGVDGGDGRCCAELSLYYFEEDYRTGLFWFEKYLQSKSVIIDDINRACYIFHCCFRSEMNGINLKDLIVKYRDVLSPLKEEIVSYAINVINDVDRDFPEGKSQFLKVAHTIKNNL
jgi:hypothetical protein